MKWFDSSSVAGSTCTAHATRKPTGIWCSGRRSWMRITSTSALDASTPIHPSALWKLIRCGCWSSLPAAAASTTTRSTAPTPSCCRKTPHPSLPPQSSVISTSRIYFNPFRINFLWIRFVFVFFKVPTRRRRQRRWGCWRRRRRRNRAAVSCWPQPVKSPGSESAALPVPAEASSAGQKAPANHRWAEAGPTTGSPRRPNLAASADPNRKCGASSASPASLFNALKVIFISFFIKSVSHKS